MAVYTKTTDFASKDSLITGDPDKVIRGSEIDTEFENIESTIGGMYTKLASYVSVADYGVTPSETAANNAAYLQTALTAGGVLYFPYSASTYTIDNTTPLQISSNTALIGNMAHVQRTDDDKPLFEIIGTAGTHKTNVRITDFHFSAANAVDTGLPNTGNDAHGVFRACFCDNFAFYDNFLTNITAGTYVADSYSTNSDWTDGYDGWMSVAEGDLPSNVVITGNVGTDSSDYTGVTGNTHWLVIGMCRNFIVADNIIDGYHSGIVVFGGKATNPDSATYLPTSGFLLSDDTDFKAFDGEVSGNVINVSNVGAWCWTARDILFSNNAITGCANEVMDAEASTRITFKGNKANGITGTAFNVFYDCDDIRFIGNEVTLDTGGEMMLMAAQDTSASTSDFGTLVIEGNKVKFSSAQGALVSSEIYAAAYLHIKYNRVQYTNLKIYGGHKNVFIEGNTFDQTKVTFSNAMIRASVAANEGVITFVDNECNGGLATTVLALGYSADDTYVHIKRNRIVNTNYGFDFGTAAVAGMNGSGVLITVECKDNVIDTLQPQPALVQDNSAVLDDTELKVIWQRNNKLNGNDCYASNPSAISNVNMRWSVGSTIQLTATAGGSFGMVCTTSGWQTNAVFKNYGAISA